jgi:hypothetical protein
VEYDVNRSRRSLEMCPSTFFQEKKASEWSLGSLYVAFLRMVAGVRFGPIVDIACNAYETGLLVGIAKCRNLMQAPKELGFGFVN